MPLGIPIPDVGALSKHFSDKCYRAVQENIRIALEKLASPSDLFTFEVSGALVDATNAVLGEGLDAFQQDFVQETAQRAAYSAVEAAAAEYPDLEQNISKTLNTAFNIINLAFLANNGLVLFMMKVVANNIINQLDSKASRVASVKDLLTQLHNILKTFGNGSPIYEEYLNNLKEALGEVTSARNNVLLVRNTLDARGIYLSQRYDIAKTQVSSALQKVRPTETNPLLAPFTNPSSLVGSGQRPYAVAGATLLEEAGIPGTREQTENLLQVPILTQKIIQEMRDYAGIVASINGMLDAFYQGISRLETLLYDSLRKYASGQLYRIYSDLGYVEGSMDKVLNGRRPNPAKVTSKSVEWTIRLSQTLAMMKLLPSEALGKIAAPLAEVSFYENTIEKLKDLDTISTGRAVLIAEDAKEDVGALEAQLLPLLLRANAQVHTFSVSEDTILLAKTLVERMNLTKSRDGEIRSLLQSFVDYPLALEEELENSYSAVKNLLEKAGLDRALDQISTGNVEGFFELNPKTASYVGAALAGLAFLKDCFETEEERERYNAIQSELESDIDLLNVEVGFNLDLRFFENLEECLRVEGLVKVFEIDEFICGLAESSGLGKAFDALNDVVKF